MREILNHPWTEPELARLREILNTNLSTRQIAHKLRRPLTSVRKKIYTLGLRRPCMAPAPGIQPPIDQLHK
jgi:hypothetical protein